MPPNDGLKRQSALVTDGPPMSQMDQALRGDTAGFYPPHTKVYTSATLKPVFDVPPTGTSTANKKKKKKKKKKIPSPNNSLEDSYKEAELKSIQFVQDCGFTENEVKLALDKLQGSGITTDSLLDKAYDVRDGLIESSMSPPVTIDMQNNPSVRPKKLQTDGAHDVQTDIGFQSRLPTHDSYSGDSESDGDESDCSSDSSPSVAKNDITRVYRRAVETEKSRIRSMIDELTIMCRMCNCSRATILLLPCGHLACCDDCLMDVRRCPINRCNKIVRGTKEVFFS